MTILRQQIVALVKDNRSVDEIMDLMTMTRGMVKAHIFQAKRRHELPRDENDTSEQISIHLPIEVRRDLYEEALARDLSGAEIICRILTNVVEDKLYKAVLDP